MALRLVTPPDDDAPPPHAEAVLGMPSTPVVALVAFTIVAALLLLGALAGIIAYREWTFRGEDEFIRLFGVDGETSVPATVSVLGLAACALLLGILAGVRRARGDGFQLHWLVLCLGFAAMAVDEGAGAHETLSGLIDPRTVAGYYIRWTWVLIAIPAVVALGLFFLPFLWHLPPRYGVGMALAGAVYLAGAVGFEVLSAAEPGTATDIVLRLAEEGLEMTGIALFFVVLWSFLRHTPWSWRSGAVPGAETTRQRSGDKRKDVLPPR